MSEYLDNQAEESENSGDTTDTSIADFLSSKNNKRKRLKVKKERKRKKRKLISDDEEEDDIDDEARIKKEMGDFVVDDVDEDDEDSDDDDRIDNDKLDMELDDDDLDLIDDNLNMQRRHLGGRVVIESDEEEEDDRERIKNKLFTKDSLNDEFGGRICASDREYHRSDEGGFESDRSEDDFVVSDDEKSAKRRQRRHRLFPGVSQQAVEDARCIFGMNDFSADYDEANEVSDEEDEYPDEGDSEIERTRLKYSEKKSTLLDTIEPAELEEKLLSAYDIRIQLEDRPERFELRRFPVTEADESELELESKWIYEYGFVNPTLSLQEESGLAILVGSDHRPDERARIEAEAPEKIRQTLMFMRNQFFEVPFIAFYRKEYVESCLSINDLWKVFQWDEKWCHLLQRKTNMQNLLARISDYISDVNPDPGIRPITERDINEAVGIQTIEDLMDVSSKFQLYYGSETAKMLEYEKYKACRSSQSYQNRQHYLCSSLNDKYTICMKNSIDEIAILFGLTPLQFAENLEWKRHEIIQHRDEPLVVAENYICTAFPTAEAVLQGAVHVVAKQISREPKVRSFLRQKYRRRLKISVRPTRKGFDEIDECHQLYPFRYINEKPISQIRHDEYFLYDQGKSNGLIEIRLYCDTDDDVRRKKTFVESFIAEQHYYKDEYSSIVDKWNQIREEAVRQCINTMLIPTFESEVHDQLLSEAHEFVIKQCTLNLYERIKTATYRSVHDDYGDEMAYSGTKILAIAYSTDRDQASFCALIDRDGQVVDHLRLVNIAIRPHISKSNELNLKQRDLEALQKFILKRQPHAIAIAGEDLMAHHLRREIGSLLIAMQSCSEIRETPVEIVDNEAAKVYMLSKQSNLEFPDYPLLLKQAISVGRLLLDPLVEYVHLCNTDSDILCVSFHPLQNEVNKDELMMALSTEFINRVNEVGVDVNHCLEFPHTAHMLQFVCGLGPRKAAQLLKVLKQKDNLLVSRTKLVTDCNMGPKVFMNCAGFIKIDALKVSEKTDTYVEVLDGSRVHPETYEWARKMAVDALEVDDGADPTSALEEILRNPDKLKDLDLDAFADELARQGFGNKSITLYDIRAELNHRYKDLRVPYESPTAERIFLLLTKETADIIGKLMLGHVMYIAYRKPREGERERAPPVRDERTGQWRCQYCFKPDFKNADEVWHHIDKCPGQPVGVKIRFDNGVTGFIPNKYLSDRPDSFFDPGERVKKNMALYCRVLELDPDKFSATCSCRSSDLKTLHPQNSSLDKFFDHAGCSEDVGKYKKMKEQRLVRSNFVKRVVSHPSFHNVTYVDAERMLQGFEQGEAVIRPSSKNPTHLTVTWKVSEGVHQHIDVKEENKEHYFSLGKTLLIGSEEFEDLDEILARHIQPMAALAREVISHKYFLEGVKAEDMEAITNHLLEEKKRIYPRIPYCLAVSYKLVGKFSLSYMPRKTLLYDYFTVTPDGFRYRQRIFQSLDHLIVWFKRNCKPVTG